ncbi:MAG: DUF4492 domain-containing protein [Bacteroidales bacterium]|jgi:hypothetical protein|nr:DUF4492 domain-containing protein [Bacteroidales bacterium]MDD2322505.1 DUF4492 domain-containing protein [Bacteroidales bacterium]MDD3009933.1 DUF4492 domain-containing protein [Bacteroidales bacterium]MDD3960477.1 DUF4492 domain-containing protein [Bacteroidales bacterium]MDY0285063.1 DUF4492 domain-containing protein [Bacteroidales bacterium]
MKGNKSHPLFSKIFYLYYDGFRSMTVGKKLWAIILIKLAIFFLVMRIFFFPDFLKTHFKNDKERSNYVFEQLINQE